MASPENYLSSTGPIPPGPDLNGTAILPHLVSSPNGPAVVSGSLAWRLGHSLSPPPDLVTLLQHFLI
jgi:hypothetical protein